MQREYTYAVSYLTWWDMEMVWKECQNLKNFVRMKCEFWQRNLAIYLITVYIHTHGTATNLFKMYYPSSHQISSSSHSPDPPSSIPMSVAWFVLGFFSLKDVKLSIEIFIIFFPRSPFPLPFLYTNWVQTATNWHTVHHSSLFPMYNIAYMAYIHLSIWKTVISIISTIYTQLWDILTYMLIVSNTLL